MTTRIPMPKLGESVTEGTVERWLKQVGERVEQWEDLVEITTDKVNTVLPSPVTGVLAEIIAAQGTVVPVGQDLAIVEEAEAVHPDEGPRETRKEAPQAPSALSVVQPRAPAVQASEPVANDAAASPGPGRASPVVRMLAKENEIDLNGVRGSGIDGRVTKEDILAIIANKDRAATGPPDALAPAPPRPVGVREAQARIGPDDQSVPLTAMRRAIAEHMVRSRQTSPHAWSMVEVDVTRLVRWREQIKEEFRGREGVGLTLLPFVLKAACEAIKEVPEVNASWGGDHVLLHRRVHLGIAVAIPSGLIVPVIRDADGRSIAGLARAAAELGEKARAGRLSPDDVTGGTFTVNNTGALGIVLSQPIINQPQAAILTMEAVVKRPVVVEEDAIAVRSIMNMALSLDHRILDGASAARFLLGVKQRLESFGPATLLY